MDEVVHGDHFIFLLIVTARIKEEEEEKRLSVKKGRCR